MTATYSTIQTYTVPSATTSYTFTSIPQTYTDLVFVVYAAVTTAADLVIQVGDDAINTGTTLYSTLAQWGNGTADGTFLQANVARSYIDYYGAPQTVLGRSIMVVNLMNYANTTTNKTFLYRSSGFQGVDNGVALYRSTARINQLKVGVANTDTLKAGTVLTLYGIKAE